jgi:hypothetical protein
MLKKVDFTESGKRYFQLRFETFNLLNHPTFAFPQLAPTNSAFGLITAQSNRSRSIQLTGRIVLSLRGPHFGVRRKLSRAAPDAALLRTRPRLPEAAETAAAGTVA